MSSDKWTHVYGGGTLAVTIVGAVGTWVSVLRSEGYKGGVMPLTVPISLSLLVAANGYSIYRNLRDARRCQKLKGEHDRSIKDGGPQLDALLDMRKRAGGQAAMLQHYAGLSAALASMLEDIWHHWHKAGEVFDRPLSKELPFKNWNNDVSGDLSMERRDFLVCYGRYIGGIENNFPNFKPRLLTIGSVSAIEYQALLARLARRQRSCRCRHRPTLPRFRNATTVR